MKTIALGFAAALALGLASLAAPASAATAQPSASQATDFSSQGYYGRDRDFRGDRGFRRGRDMRRGRFCETRTEVRRGPMGRRVVTKTRVCR